jgi:hypothetical protein
MFKVGEIAIAYTPIFLDWHRHEVLILAWLPEWSFFEVKRDDDGGIGMLRPAELRKRPEPPDWERLAKPAKQPDYALT